MGTHPAPGIHPTRNDSAEIPAGVGVDFQGPGRKERNALELLSLEVNGHLRGASAKTPIIIETDSTITVGPSGYIGGVSPGAGGKDPRMPVSLTSKKDSINVQGRVEADGGPCTLHSSKGVEISGIVNSWGGYTSVESDTGAVNIKTGGIVAACGDVFVNAGPKKGTTIICRVHSRCGNVHINNKRKKNPGNVRIGPKDTVSAYKEVYIYADTLLIEGTILANTIHKYAKVTQLDTGGCIKGKLMTKDKIDTLHATKEKTDGRPAEQSNDSRITGGSNCLLDFTMSPNAIVAQSHAKIATGPGGTIDFRGNPGWPVITCYGMTEIFCDNILLDPGVPLTSLVGPGPVFVNPAVPVKDVSTTFSFGRTGYPGRQVTLDAHVKNMGNIADTYAISVTDADGWPISLSATSVTLAHDFPFDSVITATFDVPLSAMPGVDSNMVIVTVASATEPGIAAVETAYVAVRDTNLLREFSLSLWNLESGHPGDTADVTHWLMNIAELPDDYRVIYTDSLGWTIFPDTIDNLIDPLDEAFLLARLLIPESSFDGEINKIYVHAFSRIDTATAQRDTVEITVGAVTAVEPEPPARAAIAHWSYPNPFNPSVSIRFRVSAPAADTKILIFDVNGRLVRTVFEGRLREGEHVKRWDGRNAAGSFAGSGVYFYRITIGSATASGKLVFLR